MPGHIDADAGFDEAIAQRQPRQHHHGQVEPADDGDDDLDAHAVLARRQPQQRRRERRLAQRRRCVHERQARHVRAHAGWGAVEHLQAVDVGRGGGEAVGDQEAGPGGDYCGVAVSGLVLRKVCVGILDRVGNLRM